VTRAVDVGRQLVHPGQRVQDDGVALGLGLEKLPSDAIGGRREALVLAPLIARHRVVGLDDRFHVDDVGVRNAALDVLFLLVLDAEQVQFGLELVEQ